jgi:thymidylate kinase
MTIIILEGMDCVGKTTVARGLTANSRSVLMHAGAPIWPYWYDEYVAPLEGLVEQGYDIVCDRWHLGELVWPQLFGRRPLFELEHLQKIEMQLASLAPTFLVLVVAEKSFQQECMERRKEPEYDMEEARLLYRAAYKASTLPKTITLRFEVEKEIARWKSGT